MGLVWRGLSEAECMNLVRARQANEHSASAVRHAVATASVKGSQPEIPGAPRHGVKLVLPPATITAHG
jgi:hypothetical protein